MKARACRILATCATAIVLVLGLPMTASATVLPGQVASVGVVGFKACAPAPEPASPGAGVPGALYPRPGTVSAGDPFVDPGVPISDVYGYAYQWRAYDVGCLGKDSFWPQMQTDVGNFGLAGVSASVGVTHTMMSSVVTPTWLAPLDEVVVSATALIREQVYMRWLTPIILIVGVTLLVFAGRANMPRIITSAGWVVAMLVAITYVTAYPVTASQAVDGLIQQTVSASAQASGGGGGSAQEGLNGQFDVIHRNQLYAVWVEGALGSSTSKTALEYGPDLFRASHLTWEEAATVEADPGGAGKAIVEAKKDAWVAAAAKVEASDEAAYRQLAGHNGRWSAVFLGVLQVGVTMPFLIVGGVFVALAYAAMRVAVPLLPALGLLGMLDFTRGWFIGAMTRFGRLLVLGPLFWLGALINTALVSGILPTALPFGIKVLLCGAIPVVLFKLLRPGKGMPGLGQLGRVAGLSALMRRGRNNKPNDNDNDNDDSANENANKGGTQDAGKSYLNRPVAQAQPQAEARPAPQSAASVPERASSAAGPARAPRHAPSRGQRQVPSQSAPSPTFWVEPDPQAWQPAHEPPLPGRGLEPVMSTEAGLERARAGALSEARADNAFAELDAGSVGREVDLAAKVSAHHRGERAGGDVRVAERYHDRDGVEVFKLYNPPTSGTDLSAPAHMGGER